MDSAMTDEFEEEIEDTGEVKWIISITFDNLNWVAIFITWHDRYWQWLAKQPFKIFRWRD